MVKKNLLFIVLISILFSSCEKKLYNLSMSRIPYTGNELKIDGYYYSNQSWTNGVILAVFYRNGVCIHLFLDIESNDTLNYIENEILKKESFTQSLWDTPNYVGVFRIDTKTIEIESWISARDITTFSFYGKILNDTIFRVTKWINNEAGEIFLDTITYRYRQFSPKPDSTNSFIP